MSALVEFRSKPDALPASLDAETGLLGILMSDAEAYFRLDGLQPQQFAEPIHGRLFEAIADRAGKNLGVDPVLLHERFKADVAYQELGGIEFLSNLVDYAPASSLAADYARAITDAAQRRELLELSKTLAQAARDPESPATDAIGMAEASLLAMQVQSRKLELVSAGAASAKVLAYLDAPPEAVYGVRTGLGPLDEELGPLLGGDLLLLMGRPSMGKSAAAECIALNIAEQGYGVIQINGEMTEEQMAQRHLTDICQREYGIRGPEYRDIRRRRIGIDQRRMLGQAHEVLDPLPMKMLKRPGLKLSQLRSLVRRQMAIWSRQGVPMGALIVDHVGLLHPDQPSRDRYADQTVISNTLKELADELACPVIGLNQMNRENERREDKRPQLADLRDSGSWEQDADFVIGFYREAYYAQRQPEPKKDLEWAEWDRARKSRTVEAIILKARAGECKTVNLWGDVARNAIRGAAPEDGDLL